MFNRHYQDELLYLRELGAEFARAHPTAAHFLSTPGSDPDVERLLEGFAFLTARVRQKLDDELPEVTHELLGMLWPHFLRPVPSMSILEFSPVLPALRQTQRVARGVAVQSVPVEGTACRFRTAYDVVLQPLSIEQVQLEATAAGPSRLWIGFRLWNQAKIEALDLSRVRLYLHGDSTLTYALYYHLRLHVAEVLAGADGPDLRTATSALRTAAVEPAGMGEDESLIPYPARSFVGYRLLQEYFALQEKFLFFDLCGLERLREVEIGDRFWVEIRFDRALAPSLRPTKDEVRLYCTPIVNLFEHESDPLRIDQTQVEYRLRPAGASPLHYEVYSIDKISGFAGGTAQERVIPSFHSFSHDETNAPGPLQYYFSRLRLSVVDDRADTFLSFVNARSEQVVPPVETIVAQITCTNRRLCEALRVGDISVPTDTSPGFARFKNLTVPTPSVPPPLEGDLHWRLISHLSLNYVSLLSVEALRGVLGLYNYQAMRDPRASRANALRLEGIQSITARPKDLLLDGSLVRGLSIAIEMREDRFAADGDLYLFSSVLAEFFRLYASINSFTETSIRGVQKGERYHWPAEVGRRPLL